MFAHKGHVISKKVIDDIIVFEISGTITMDFTEELRAEILKGIPKDNPYVVIDLVGLEYCDSSGLGILTNVQGRIVKAHGILALCGVHGRLDDVMSLCNIRACFKILDNQEEAVEHVQEEKKKKLLAK
jgi:anti-sigma B factor antagonist